MTNLDRFESFSAHPVGCDANWCVRGWITDTAYRELAWFSHMLIDPEAAARILAALLTAWKEEL